VVRTSKLEDYTILHRCTAGSICTL